MFMVPAKHQALVRSAIAVLAMSGALQQAKAETPAPRNQDLFEVMEGDRIAHTLCINCHVVGTSGPAVRTDRELSFSWIANQQGLTSTTLAAWLGTSHKNMPDFSLTRDEIRLVSAYILSLRK
jgi:mono/diheme cytochrome c family protein